MSNFKQKQEFYNSYSKLGPEKFYRFLLASAVASMAKPNEVKIPPDLELLDFYEKFLIISRREDDEIYLNIAILCRKAAHKVYRVLLKKELTARNGKFLNIVE
jgi:hypothetical protein